MVKKNEKKKSKDNILLYSLIFLGSFLGMFFAWGLLLLMRFKNTFIDITNINLLDMYIKASYAFFGSFFSGIVALMMFLKQQKYKKQDEKSELQNLFENAIYEKDDNLKSIKKLITHIDKYGTSDTAKVFAVSAEMKELVLIIYTDLDVTSYLAYQSSVDKIESEQNEKLLLVFKIYNLFGVLLGDLKNENSSKTILELIVEKYNKIIDP